MEQTLPRRLGLWDAASTVVGIILGSGIFMAPATIAALAPTPLKAALWWLGGVTVAVCGALSYAECGARLPRDGGFFVFYEHVWGSDVARAAGWAALLVTYPASLAGVALVGAHYFSDALPVFANAGRWVPAGMLALAALLNIVGVQLGLWAQRILSAAKALTLLCVCAAALWAGHTPAPSAATVPLPTGATYLAGFAVMMWTYDGWTDVTMLAGEIRDPARNLSRAVILGLSIVATLYILAQTAVLVLLGGSAAASSTQVLADATAAALGSQAGHAVSWLVFISAAGAVHTMTLVTSRLAHAMACQGAIPRWFAAISPLFQTPARAVGAVLVASLAYVVHGTFEDLISFFAVVIWIFYGLTGLTLLRLRRAGVGEPLAWRAPGGLLPPAVLMLAAVLTTALQLVENPLRIGAVALLVGVVLVRRWSAARARQV